MKKEKIAEIEAAMDGYLNAMRNGFLDLLATLQEDDKPVEIPVIAEQKPDRLFSAPEAADYLHLSYAYFRRLSKGPDSPPFYDFGTVKRYRESDLDNWAANRKRYVRKQA